MDEAILFHKQKLEVLDISYNLLSGSVSQVLGGLTSILLLNISNNFFTGGLLEIYAYPNPNLDVLNISDASNALQILDLSMNHFSGGLIVEDLTNCTIYFFQQLFWTVEQETKTFPFNSVILKPCTQVSHIATGRLTICETSSLRCLDVLMREILVDLMVYSKPIIKQKKRENEYNPERN